MNTLKNIMERKVKVISENAPIREAAKVLMKNKLSGIPVVDKNKQLKGFISERDIITAVATNKNIEKKVKDIMTEKVIFLEDYTTLEVVSKVFTEHPIRYLPVTRNKKLVGIISRQTVIGKLLKQYY